MREANDTVYSWSEIKEFFGHVHLETRMRPEGNRIIGEGRARHFDVEGRIVKDTGWEPTGIVITWPDRRRWWEFWK